MTKDRLVSVTVEPLPTWLERERMLGTREDSVEAIDAGHVRVGLRLSMTDAARLAARLRGLGIDGRALEVRIDPPPPRTVVRAARLEDARDRRSTTPGFTRREARATGEGRYSLTPEALALALGERAGGRSVLDACCGSGGNAIGFARAGSRVTALELDAERLAEAEHNARVYGVLDGIRFVHGDARELVPHERADILFVDPPWGEQYDKRRTTRADFPLLDALLALPLASYGAVWLKLPASFEIESVPGASASAWFGTAAGDRHRIKFVLLELAR